MLTLCSLSATPLSFLIRLSQQAFISGIICFIFKALKAGVKVLRIRFHLSFSAVVNILANGSGCFTMFYNNKSKVNLNSLKNVL